MSVQFFDGLTPYGSINHMLGRWSSVDATSKALVVQPMFPNQRAVRFDGTSTNDGITFQLREGTDELIIGFFLLTGAFNSVRKHLFELKNAAGEVLLDVDAGSGVSGIRFRADGSTTLFTLSPPTTGTAFYYEVKVKLAEEDEYLGTTGYITVLRDGVQIQHSELETTLRTDKVCTQIEVGRQNGGALVGWDLDLAHWYVLSVDEGVAGDFLGSPSIEYRGPNSDVQAEWVPSDAYAENYEMVDEDEANEDTDYVESELDEDKDLYGITPFSLGVGHAVLAIQTHSVHKNAGVGQSFLRHVVLPNYEEFESEEISIDATTYRSASDMHTVNPETTLEWTREELDTLTAGIVSETEEEY